ncbi:hypothetical protein HanLR1_Chr16g0635391 [Helianthus annuus]|nr:hypothetical protein HanHA89_Chr16g0676281 [Helianthus annuus]KAJ0642172.1 hypothetical protein HanLR1_Chr16g0635391 [Helianthus annuus]
MTINNLFIYFFPFVSFNSTADSSYHSRKRVQSVRDGLQSVRAGGKLGNGSKLVGSGLVDP